MIKGEFKTVADVWKALDEGETVFWTNTAYKIYVEDDHDPNSDHEGRIFARRDGKILCARCIENYFGSILYESELRQLFTKEAS